MTMHLAGAGPTEPSLESMAAEPMFTREYEARPAEFYQRLRDTYGPVAPVDVLGVPAWLVLGYTQALDVLQDRQGRWTKHISSWPAWSDGRVPADWPLRHAFGNDCLLVSDGRKADRLRSAWILGLRPYQDRTHRQARELENTVGRYADELIDVLSEGSSGTGWADLSAQYARPLPLMVLNRMIGFADDRGDDLLMDLWRAMDAGPEAVEAMGRMYTVTAETIEAKRKTPGEDLTSYLIGADPGLSTEDLCKELILAMSMLGDFTGTLISNTAAAVIGGDHSTRESLSAGMLQETVNRVAMANPPMANISFRFAQAPVRLGRFAISVGDPVFISVAAAHMDPVFTGHMNPDSITSSRAHLAWSTGLHGCLGRDLATTITTIAIGRLFERFSALKLALPADQLPWRSSPFLRSLRSLPVEYELSGPPPGARQPAGGAPGQPANAGAQPPRSRMWRFLRGLRKDSQ
ncbi:cytochrome [Actinomadura xylanilytica]|uniref:cytochrome n=1 Tax=Actinomadura xylanilytica TaxID=887459 RepID=UPI00255AD785|nr:cytochrome [Actinomadura xylanilytica]MDL4772434.1 cytochrome [Actinomadura xylanilytica]